MKNVSSQDCWEWRGKTRNGYGVLSGKLAHRALYEAWYGKLERGVLLRHQCHNRACVNPDHMLPGTQLENVSDSIRDGRAWMYGTHGNRGERSGRAKLTNAQAQEIRDRYGETMRQHWVLRRGVSCASIGREYGVSEVTIRKILSERSYRGPDPVLDPDPGAA